MSQWIGAFIVLENDPTFVLSVHLAVYTAICNSSFRGPDALLLAPGV